VRKNDESRSPTAKRRRQPEPWSPHRLFWSPKPGALERTDRRASCKARRLGCYGHSALSARLRGLYRPKPETVAPVLWACLPRVRWTEPEGGFVIGTYLLPEVDTSLLQVRTHEAGVRLTDGRGFFPEKSGSAFLRLPFCALSPEEIREGIERLGRVGSTLIQ
jgi:DNA-binding transcriptional MocR family regulator